MNRLLASRTHAITKIKSIISPTSASSSSSKHKYLSTAALPTSPFPRFTIPSLPLISSSTLNNASPVGKWLIGTSAFISLIVSVGGITRLTKSGLSMTTWNALGDRPPLNSEDWVEEFERYKLSPEFDQRRSMTMGEFKVIYFWEWGHRMLGRCAGIIFIAPALYFTARRMIPKGYYPRILTLLTLGGTQGLIGWWMVKSGLGDDRRGDKKEIRVSPYRLATHLSTAFATYSLCLWTGLDLLHPREAMNSAGNFLVQNSQKLIPKLQKLRIASIATTSLIAVTVISGAFVAGNDAGNAYNDWPYMNGSFIPEDLIDETVSPVWRNVFESTAFVQFDHRILAYSTTAAIGGVYAYSRSLNKFYLLTPQVTNAIRATGSILFFQVSLGISTLMLYVPVPLAATHQLGSLALLSSGIYLVHSLRYVGVAAGKVAGRKAAGISTKAGEKLLTGKKRPVLHGYTKFP